MEFNLSDSLWSIGHIFSNRIEGFTTVSQLVQPSNSGKYACLGTQNRLLNQVSDKNLEGSNIASTLKVTSMLLNDLG